MVVNITYKKNLSRRKELITEKWKSKFRLSITHGAGASNILSHDSLEPRTHLHSNDGQFKGFIAISIHFIGNHKFGLTYGGYAAPDPKEVADGIHK